MAVTTAQVQQAYVAFFNRPADLAGLNYWTSSPAASVANLLDAFSKTPEYTSLYSNMNSTQLVNAVYQNLFGRPVESVDALNYWVGLLDKGTVTLGSIAATVADLAITNKTADGTLVSNKVAAATAFTTSLSTASNATAATAYATANSTGLQAVKNWLAAVTSDATTLTNATSTTTLDSLLNTVKSNVASTGSTFMLTAGADNVVGTAGNDTINVINVNGAGTAATTAQSFDKVDGGAGTDTLNWYATTTENTAIDGTFSNIEIVKFFGAQNVGGGTIDSSLIGGSKEVWLEAAGGAVTVTGLSGKTLGVAGKTTGTVTGNFGTGAAATLALNAASDAAGTGNASVDIAGVATSLAVSGAGKAILTDNGTGADTIKTLTVAATGATTLNVTGLGALTAIDGSASTSNTTLVGIAASATSIKTGAGSDTFTVTATSKAAVDSGAGNDVVTLSSAIAAGSTINLGAGNDKLLFATGGSVAVSTSTVIDGGDGIDSVSAQLITAGNAAQFKNFELLNLDSTTGLDLALLAANNTLTGLTISRVGTTATYQNVSKALGLTVDLVGDNSANTNTLQFKDVTGTDDSYSIKFAADNSAATSAPTAANVKAGTLVAAGIENFNIESGGAKAWNSITLGADTSAKTVTITGAANLDLAFASGFGNTTAPQTGVTSIDGSAATGALSINLANVVPATAGLSVKTGAGNDTIIVSATGGTITTGAGKDVVDVKGVAAGSTSAPIITTITDFTVGQDKLTLKDQGTETFAATKVNVDTATALFGGTVNALDLAATANGGVNAAITWFQYAGDTYVVQDLSTSMTAFTANDIVVKLTGLVDLSGLTVADFNFA